MRYRGLPGIEQRTWKSRQRRARVRDGTSMRSRKLPERGELAVYVEYLPVPSKTIPVSVSTGIDMVSNAEYSAILGDEDDAHLVSTLIVHW